MPKIKSILPLPDYHLRIAFDDGRIVLYDMNEDMNTLPGYDELRQGLFSHVQVDASRTCIFWNEDIDLPSDTLYEFGVVI